MLSKTFGGTVIGVDALIVTIEINVTQGTKFYMVGLPDNAVKESAQRVESSIKYLNYKFPRQKVVVNLAPADVRKEGAAYDLTMAIGILFASRQIITEKTNQYLIMGELSLDGKLRPIRGVLPIAIEAQKKGMKGFILPHENAAEAAIVNDLEVIGVNDLKEAILFLTGEKEIEPSTYRVNELFDSETSAFQEDFSQVQGQENIKRGLEIAAAGGHNLAMIGPPGAGKTMLAKRISSILPPLTMQEALETTKIHSVAGKLGGKTSLITKRPFRAPHHTISHVALVGGGSNPQPGEISLAHNGVLFLDELPEFKRDVLEVMRQPLEERVVTISRAKISVDFPANFMLVASMNPCPCGYYDHEKQCDRCNASVAQRYLGKVSGPLMDRMDLHIEVTPVTFSELSNNRKAESSALIRNRVIRAREMQNERFSKYTGLYANAMMPAALVKKICLIEKDSLGLLQMAMEQLSLSARAYDRILKVARTIADLSQSEKIETDHIAEAIHYRSLDRKNWTDT